MTYTLDAIISSVVRLRFFIATTNVVRDCVLCQVRGEAEEGVSQLNGVFSVRHELRLKKQLSNDHITQHCTTEMQYAVWVAL